MRSFVIGSRVVPLAVGRASCPGEVGFFRLVSVLSALVLFLFDLVVFDLFFSHRFEIVFVLFLFVMLFSFYSLFDMCV